MNVERITHCMYYMYRVSEYGYGKALRDKENWAATNIQKHIRRWVICQKMKRLTKEVRERAN